MGALIESGRRATSMVPSRDVVESGQYLTFMLTGEVYAVGILNIKEIIEYGGLTEVPMMPSFIRGVINLRGQVVPVVDLAARFGKGATGVARRTSIVIVETTSADPEHDGSEHVTQYIGVMVDAVNEVVEIAHGDIEPPPAFGAKIRPSFISGMAKLGERFTIVLNVSQVLSIEEMATIGESLLGEHHALETELT